MRTRRINQAQLRGVVVQIDIDADAGALGIDIGTAAKLGAHLIDDGILHFERAEMRVVDR